MSPPTKSNSEEHYNKTGEDESKNTTTDTKKIGMKNNQSEHFWFKDQQQPILADIFTKTQDVYF